MNDEHHLTDSASLEPPLEAAVKAVLAAPISEEASERVKTRAKHMAVGMQAETIHPAPRARFPRTWSWIRRHPASAVTAATIFVVAIAGVTLWFHGGGATPAFADFLQPILDAETVRYKVTIETTGTPAALAEMAGLSAERQKELMKPHTFEVMDLGFNRVRLESEMPDKSKRVVISDGRQRKQLVLEPAEKRATLYNYSQRPDDKTTNNEDRGLASPWRRPEEPGPVALFRALLLDTVHKPDGQRESLGEKEIDGRRVVGFRLSVRGTVLSVWGDPKTRVPVRIEATMALMPHYKVTASDFEFNVPMDESLFSVDTPAGYTVTVIVKQSQPSDDSPTGEKDLIEMFRCYGQWSGGRFPDLLDAQWIAEVVSKTSRIGANLGHDKPQAQRDQEREAAEHKIYRGMMFAVLLPKDADRHYAGRGVSLGAADTPVFWYRPKDAKKYRVIYADLSVRDADTPPSMSVVPPEQELLNALRYYSQLFDGRFPISLDDPTLLGRRYESFLWIAYSKVYVEFPADVEYYPTATQRQELMKATKNIQPGVDFVASLPPQSDWHYAGWGISLGAADRPIFWYRPEDSKKYRVIYADLSVRDADVPPNVAAPPPLDDLVDALRHYSELSDETFPDALDPENLFRYREKEFGKYAGPRPTAKQVKECAEIDLKLQPGVAFAASLPPEADAHYAGKGVVRGKAGTPIFWYRPKDAQAYRVIYADLSVREADTPPSVANAQPVPGPLSPKQ